MFAEIQSLIIDVHDQRDRKITFLSEYEKITNYGNIDITGSLESMKRRRKAVSKIPTKLHNDVIKKTP